MKLDRAKFLFEKNRVALYYMQPVAFFKNYLQIQLIKYSKMLR